MFEGTIGNRQDNMNTIVKARACAAGGKYAFVWDIMHRTCSSLSRPLILFIKDAEHTICGSYEREAAYQDAFGSRTGTHDSCDPTKGFAAVLIAGCSLGEAGVDIVLLLMSALHRLFLSAHCCFVI